MRWSDALQQAAERFDGGDASFPASRLRDMASRLGYAFPNDDYDKLFFRRPYTPKPTAGGNVVGRPKCAGWVIPDPRSQSVCKPVFVAHSTFAAIWLLRETLGHSALPDRAWNDLFDAARKLATGLDDDAAARSGDQQAEGDECGSDREGVPPSAQVLVCGLKGSAKRVGAVLSEASPKRARTGSGPLDEEAAEAEEEAAEAEEEADEVDNGAAGNDEEEKGVDETAQGAADVSESVGHMTTTSNNNRRAEQSRKRRWDGLQAKKRLEMGLVEPGEKAAVQERAAYSSIPAKDEPTIAWIMKQKLSAEADFYTASPTPYFTAVSVLEKARALGNQSSQHCAARFLHAWREQGTPFRVGTEDYQLIHSSPRSISDAGSQLQGGADRAFCFAWGMCKRYETALAAVHIGSRWALALLGEAYAQKIQQIRQGDFVASNDRSRNRYGKGRVRTEAISALMELVCETPTKRDHEVFRNRLKQAMRWHTIVKGLGWGSLLLIPPEEVSNWWVERVLRVGQLDVFVNVVKRERPDLCAASKALEAWLGPDGIAGGPISGKRMLSIEAEPPAAAYEVHEVADSDDAEMLVSEEDSEEEGVEEEGAEEDVAQPRRFRQMTLTELFHPLKE